MLVLAIKQFTQTQEYPVHLVGGNEMETCLSVQGSDWKISVYLIQWWRPQRYFHLHLRECSAYTEFLQVCKIFHLFFIWICTPNQGAAVRSLPPGDDHLVAVCEVCPEVQPAPGSQGGEDQHIWPPVLFIWPPALLVRHPQHWQGGGRALPGHSGVPGWGEAEEGQGDRGQQ